MDTLTLITLIVAVGIAFLAFILPGKMVQREAAGKCYEDCMRRSGWEPGEACITNCRLQD